MRSKHGNDQRPGGTRLQFPGANLPDSFPASVRVAPEAILETARREREGVGPRVRGAARPQDPASATSLGMPPPVEAPLAPPMQVLTAGALGVRDPVERVCSPFGFEFGVAPCGPAAGHMTQ